MRKEAFYMCNLITKHPSTSFYLVAFDDNEPYGSREKIVKTIAKLNGNNDDTPDISQYKIQNSLYYIRNNKIDIEKEFCDIDEEDDILIIPISPLLFSPKVTWSKHSNDIMSRFQWYEDSLANQEI